MALDQQVEDYLEELKKIVYRDGQEYKNGSMALNEMLSATQGLIKSRKIYYLRTKNFLNTRLVRLNKIKDSLLNYVSVTQLQGKYDIFIKNARALANTSTTMDTINANINITVGSFLKKVNQYNREIEEINNRLIRIDIILNFYSESSDTLDELKNKISSL